MNLRNYVAGAWLDREPVDVEIRAAASDEVVATIGAERIDFGAAVRYGREVGGVALRGLTFQERAAMLRRLGEAIAARKDELFALSGLGGATHADSGVDIDGGLGTMFAYAARGRRDLPNDRILLDGPSERLSKRGSFVGQHILSPLRGVAVHINAYNFPVWGMLEKLSPALLAGVPVLVKPAPATAYLAEQCVRIMIESGVLPAGALQLIVGSPDALLDQLTGQDIVLFTGSAETARRLRGHPAVLRQNVRFIAECDSLNAAVLGPDSTPETPEFTLFVDEVVREMTVKTGQKCTAIRRILVPAELIDAAQAALVDRLAGVVVGPPDADGVTMGPLVGRAQLERVRAGVAVLATQARVVFGTPEPATPGGGAYISPVLLRCDQPWSAPLVHEVEVFGPVATLMPYADLADAIRLCQEGQGSLVMSLFTHDPAVAATVTDGVAAYHGRLLLADRDSAGESTGHGAPLPGLVHGGPGRAGGGEELGGLRALGPYMQRTALQGSPALLTAVVGRWLDGAPRQADGPHPFRRSFDELDLGVSFESASREVTLDDIEHFAGFTGDNFYAHMDEQAAAANPFFPGRVAHGYLILSFAAGLFVDPAPGPVLANYGLDNLRFVKPVSPGDTIAVQLTAMAKNRRNADYGEVRWDARVTNQHGEAVATYELLTLNAISLESRPQ